MKSGFFSKYMKQVGAMGGKGSPKADLSADPMKTGGTKGALPKAQEPAAPEMKQGPGKEEEAPRRRHRARRGYGQ